MVAHRKLSLREKEIINGNYFETNSVSETARIVGRSKSVVSRVLKRYNEENSLEEKQKSGRPRKTDKRDNKVLVRMAKENRFKSSRKLANKFSENETQ